VVLKEYLPRKLAHRTWGNRVVPHDESTQGLYLKGRKLFLEEARVLSKLKHPNIVEVQNFFQANDTVYLVMTYEYGKILSDYIHDFGKSLDYPLLLTISCAVLECLQVIHQQGLLHLDIKPGNILIRPGGDPLILDFGAVQPFPYDGSGKTGHVLTHGYSAIEQYHPIGKLGPWSDVYSVGATLRMCLEDKLPPPAPQRLQKDPMKPAVKAFARKYPPHFLSAIDTAMAVSAEQRPQEARQMRELLQAAA
jgi:serine/threonine protein kinase